MEQQVATIGFFDGVHRGHRYLIEQVCRAARERGMKASVITFPIHPRKVMQPDFCPRLLTTCEEKSHLLLATGIDYCHLIPFNSGIAHLSACQFMELLKEKYNVQVLVIGHDHRFGHNRSEGFEDYVRYGEALGMEVLPAQAFYHDGRETVSSSLIRRLVTEGCMSQANELLGYEYFLEGTVVSGYQVGRRIGFPTANLRVKEPDKLIPADGVYAVRVALDGKQLNGMLSIGRRPTLENGTERSIETHIFDFDGDIYQAPMRITFVCRTRDELKFDSPEALRIRLQEDEKEIRKILQTTL